MKHTEFDTEVNDMIILLKDLSKNEVDAVILTKETTPEKVEEIISEVKNKYPSEWTDEDIMDALPSDCEFYRVGDCEIAWY